MADGSAALVTAAQAARWFDLPAFSAQARRIAAAGAALALISYGVVRVEPDLRKRFDRFYWREIGPFWPPERRLVETGYRSIDFPFPQVPVATLSIRRSWTLDAFLGHLGTWSAVRNAAGPAQGGRAGWTGRPDRCRRPCPLAGAQLLTGADGLPGSWSRVQKLS